MLNQRCFLLLIIFNRFFFRVKQTYHPKPKGLNKINLPKPQYKVVTVSNNYSFEKNNLASTNENKDLDGLI